MDYISNFNIPLVAVRIYASDEKREKRGWAFTEVRLKIEMGFRSVEGKCYFQGIDDAPYECNLDDFKDWDFLIDTDCQGNAEAVFQDIKSIVKYVLSTQIRESSIYVELSDIFLAPPFFKLNF